MMLNTLMQLDKVTEVQPVMIRLARVQLNRLENFEIDDYEFITYTCIYYILIPGHAYAHNLKPCICSQSQLFIDLEGLQTIVAWLPSRIRATKAIARNPVYGCMPDRRSTCCGYTIAHT
jgi:hypothetical protein